MNAKQSRKTRLELFDAGNDKCPICLSAFTRNDVLNGNATLEHAPPESAGGSVVCLTCKECNSVASEVDEYAVRAKHMIEDWSSGRGISLEMEFFGHKTTSKFYPDDPKSPIPISPRDLPKGEVKIGSRLSPEK